mmetsp:Transcript_14506/g.31037  ORF Transcript_14506/g.31037 Transcript_14506/m.31037 type:complete len:208 (+) Transcript_14506:789-1412(+)
MCEHGSHCAADACPDKSRRRLVLFEPGRTLIQSTHGNGCKAKVSRSVNRLTHHAGTETSVHAEWTVMFDDMRDGRHGRQLQLLLLNHQQVHRAVNERGNAPSAHSRRDLFQLAWCSCPSSDGFFENPISKHLQRGDRSETASVREDSPIPSPDIFRKRAPLLNTNLICNQRHLNTSLRDAASCSQHDVFSPRERNPFRCCRHIVSRR